MEMINVWAVNSERGVSKVIKSEIVFFPIVMNGPLRIIVCV